MEDFHDALFPIAISFGATGGPERKVEIVQLTSGREARNLRLRHSRRRYDAGTGVRALSDLYAVLDFFEARRGPLHAFRFRDPFDMRSCLPDAPITPVDQPLGFSEPGQTVFPIIKTYGAGENAYARPIRKSVAGSVRCALDGLELEDEAFSVDAAGNLTLAEAPAPGALITAGFEFHVPVRFDIEHLFVSLTAFKAGQIPNIPLIEVSL